MPRWPKKEESITVEKDGTIPTYFVEAVPTVPPTPIQIKEKVEPLQPGQKYFEAPDGTIIVGEADKSEIWYRKLNDGKGGWINPKR
jgi:hypothetical protein